MVRKLRSYSLTTFCGWSNATAIVVTLYAKNSQLPYNIFIFLLVVGLLLVGWVVDWAGVSNFYCNCI